MAPYVPQDGFTAAQQLASGADGMTQNPNLAALSVAGVSVWLDDLSRTLLQSGKLQQLIVHEKRCWRDH